MADESASLHWQPTQWPMREKVHSNTQVTSERGYAYTIHSNVFVSYLPILSPSLRVCFSTLLLPVCVSMDLSPSPSTIYCVHLCATYKLLHSRKAKRFTVYMHVTGREREREKEMFGDQDSRDALLKARNVAPCKTHDTLHRQHRQSSSCSLVRDESRMPIDIKVHMR